MAENRQLMGNHCSQSGAHLISGWWTYDPNLVKDTLVLHEKWCFILIKILHMSRQLSCRGMCKHVIWLTLKSAKRIIPRCELWTYQPLMKFVHGITDKADRNYFMFYICQSKCMISFFLLYERHQVQILWFEHYLSAYHQNDFYTRVNMSYVSDSLVAQCSVLLS